MIKAVPKVVENAAASSWKFYLRGLWESGLRLSESLVLRWDDAPGAIVVDRAGRRPLLRIAAEAGKGNQGPARVKKVTEAQIHVLASYVWGLSNQVGAPAK